MNDKPDPPVIEGEIVEDSAGVPTPPPAFDYTEGGVPTFDYVRDRIENRTATSAGAKELADETPQGRSIDEQMAERDRAGREKLEEIRRQMRGE
ncbi:MAG: hypothetical protein ABW215_00325 [Kibdelosporangium sp.]